MTGKFLLRTSLILLTAVNYSFSSNAQSRPPGYPTGQSIAKADKRKDLLEDGLWYDQGKTAKIQIFKAADGMFYGKIVWLKVPNVDGKPKVDNHNPDKAKRNDPLMGLMILRGLKKVRDHEYEDGTIYDPKNGKTYTCKVFNNGETLSVRGYMGFSVVGKTTTWTKTKAE